jgi:glyoxylase-like metal-dependent hydrolase (beta-lactamase superfamily II)
MGMESGRATGVAKLTARAGRSVLLSLLLAAFLTPDGYGAAERLLAPGVVLLPGDVPDERGPDGNTVIFTTPAGLVVIDTGRHQWQSDAILAYAAGQHRPVVAIVNSHWHLDHSSGNRRIKAVYPQAPIYTTTAIDRAIGSFLAPNLVRTKARLASGKATGIEAEEAQGFIDTMNAGDSLRPEVPILQSGPLVIGGKDFDVHVTDHAVTDADVWLYDPQSRIAVVGDLVTLPAPFLDTACTERWREALDQVWAIDFRIAIPGHGEPMTRSQFDTYRRAFGEYVSCARGGAEASACAAKWRDAAAELMPGERWRHMASEYAEYYVTLLRGHNGNSGECQKP